MRHSEIQWQTKIIKMWSNRTSFQVGWSRPRDPSTIKLTSYFSLCGQWNLFSSGQLLGKFLCDVVKLSWSNTMRYPSLETKSRQLVWQHRISRLRLRKCLESSGHSSGVMPLSLYGTYCWGHSPALTNQNYTLKWRHKYVSAGLMVSGTPYLVWGPCVPPSRSGPPRRCGPQWGVGLDLIKRGSSWLLCWLRLEFEGGGTALSISAYILQCSDTPVWWNHHVPTLDGLTFLSFL